MTVPIDPAINQSKKISIQSDPILLSILIAFALIVDKLFSSVLSDGYFVLHEQLWWHK